VLYLSGLLSCKPSQASWLRQTQIIGADRWCGSSTTDFTLVSLYEIPISGVTSGAAWSTRLFCPDSRQAWAKGVTQRSVWGIPTSPSPLWTYAAKPRKTTFLMNRYTALLNLCTRLWGLSTNRFTLSPLTDWLWDLEPALPELGHKREFFVRRWVERKSSNNKALWRKLCWWPAVHRACSSHVRFARSSFPNPNLRFWPGAWALHCTGSSARRTMGSALLHLKKRSTSSATQRSWKSWLKDISQIWSNY